MTVMGIAERDAALERLAWLNGRIAVLLADADEYNLEARALAVQVYGTDTQLDRGRGDAAHPATVAPPAVASRPEPTSPSGMPGGHPSTTGLES